MRAIAMADCHLGFSAFPREIGGRNVRELDVEAAWERSIDNAIAWQPDVVHIAGDVVHHPRVSIFALKAYRDGIRRLVEETDAYVIIEQGNHDAPRTSSSTTPLILSDDYPRVFVVTEPTRIPLTIERTGERVAFACFPYVSLGSDIAFKVEPDPTVDLNVLLVHAAVQSSEAGDALPYFYGGIGALEVGQEADRWDVIAVGDYHEFTRLHPTRLAFYSGSIERTSTNIWPEKAPKGIVAYDTADGSMEFIEHPTRPVFDFGLGDFDPGSIEDIDAGVVNTALRDLLNPPAEPRVPGWPLPPDVSGAIVRLVVPNFPRDQRADIDWAAVTELKAKCLHFQLDLHLSKTVREDGVVDRRTVEGGYNLNSAAEAFFAGDPEPVRAIAFRHLEIGQEVPA